MDRSELRRLHDRAVGHGRRYYADGRVNDLVKAVSEYLDQDDPTVELAYLKVKLADVEAERDQLKKRASDLLWQVTPDRMGK